MKKYLIISVLFVFSLCSYSQAYITLVSNNSASFYTSVDSAVYYATNDDYIYIPGNTFNIGNLEIDKKVHIVGVGHYPDSTSATGITSLGGNIYLLDGADETTISGIYLSGNIFFGSTTDNQDVDNISITRSNVYSITLGASFPSSSDNILIEECVIRGVLNGNASATNVLIKKCIFNYYITYMENATFSNNIFLYEYNNCSGGSWGNYCHSPLGLNHADRIISCLFENNIFFDSYSLKSNYSLNTWDYVQNSIFNNNLFCDEQVFPYNGGNIGQNNINNQSRDSIFINKTQNTFSYTNDYHLMSSSPGKNAGTDGTDIGIYGTSEPYKEGAVPTNPHIQTKTIQLQDNMLQIDIKVSAQDQ